MKYKMGQCEGCWWSSPNPIGERVTFICFANTGEERYGTKAVSKLNLSKYKCRYYRDKKKGKPQ